jgi:hypothetical protein
VATDYVLTRWSSAVRVADFVQQCAVFIGQTIDGEFVPLGTGFFVGYPFKDGAFQYLVTAAHCVQAKTDLQLRINLRNGQSAIFDIPSDQWIFHPDPDRVVDIAAMVSHVSLFLYDIQQISLRKEMVTDNIIKELDIGLGDEVFFPGLFIHHNGQGRNLPIIRAGTIAAMRDEPIKTVSGSMSAYLIEARSIGGHSGSPVFVNIAAPRRYQAKEPRSLPLPGQERRDYYLLGLIRGHFRAKNSGEYLTSDPATEDLQVNSGIAIVVPAQDIWDTLSQPELDEERLKSWQATHADSAAVLDSR